MNFFDDTGEAWTPIGQNDAMARPDRMRLLSLEDMPRADKLQRICTDQTLGAVSAAFQPGAALEQVDHLITPLPRDTDLIACREQLPCPIASRARRGRGGGWVG